MFIVVMDFALKENLISKGCELIRSETTLDKKDFWILKKPESFNFDFEEKYRGKYFFTEHIRFDF